jgi:trk system potassium uptake protein TrkA
VVGRRIEELPVIKGAHIAAIVREAGDLQVVQMDGFLVDKPVARVIIPHHDTVIEENDHVVVFCSRKREVPQVEKLFQVGFQFL